MIARQRRSEFLTSTNCLNIDRPDQVGICYNLLRTSGISSVNVEALRGKTCDDSGTEPVLLVF